MLSRTLLHQCILLILAIGISAFFLFSVVIVHFFHQGYPVSYFFGDPATLMGAPFFVGFLTNVRVLFWCVGSAICFFAFWLLRRDDAARDVSGFLFSLGLISGVFMADDFFLIHEVVLPRYFHVPEPTVYALYCMYYAYFCLRYRQIIARSDLLLFIFSSLALGFTLVVDMLHINSIYFSGHLLESLKFVGIVTFCLYSFRTSLRWVRAYFH